MKDWFKNLIANWRSTSENDPVKCCPVHVSEGCAHVDGLGCEPTSCCIIESKDYVMVPTEIISKIEKSRIALYDRFVDEESREYTTQVTVMTSITQPLWELTNRNWKKIKVEEK